MECREICVYYSSLRYIICYVIKIVYMNCILREEFFKSALYIALNVMKLTFFYQMHKKMFSVKNCVHNVNISYAGLHKRFRVHYELLLEMAESVFSIELYYFFCYYVKF